MPLPTNILTVNRIAHARVLRDGVYVDTVVWQNVPELNQYENDDFSLELIATSSLDNEVSYEIAGGLDANLFVITDGYLTLTARNYETPTDSNVDNVYEVSILAFTSAGSATLNLEITILDIFEDYLALSSSIAGSSISENSISG
jgi:hypothetical protein